MNTRSTFRWAKYVVTIAIAIAFAFAAKAQSNDSARINDLLKNVKSHAALATHDAEMLQSFTRSDLSWQSHAIQINMIKEHINNLIEDHNAMIAAREEASPWQQKAIDRTDPVVKEIADRLTATIDHLNNNQNKIKLQAYRDYVHSSYELITTLDKMVNDFVNYEEAKSKADTLEQDLELPASSGEAQ
ncbi:MAG: hypothetical protein KGN79_06265 [Acidobacteriota bacterium]|nr:hypothetical protein [Acidobacteriota bacterium]